ncbi:MAG: hypothetical protein EU550_02895 [Promethearchaeota archaeon]|nr:MAG: hypothetical protein EU550_02895 [Candidatus Lokiarchaeota archaeon]
MTTKNPTGYCPICKQRVLLQREEIDNGLAILLLIFTAGIGFIIYLILYYSKPENRCVHCNSEVIPTQSIPNYEQQDRLSYQDNSNHYLHQETKPNVRSRYCRLCGSKIDTEDQRFCSNCGCEL